MTVETLAVELTISEIEILVAALADNVRLVFSLGATPEMLQGAQARIAELEEILKESQ